MECLRKAEEKSKESENRMPSIVEAGALAVATTVKPHSLTSNNDITPIASFPKECLIEESFYRLPVSQKPPRRVNTVIQHNLERNRLLVLMILFATSGFVMWNGEEWRALWEKKKKEKEEDEKEEKMLSESTTMEVLRVSEARSKNRMTGIVEAGTLAIARNVAPEQPDKISALDDAISNKQEEYQKCRAGTLAIAKKIAEEQPDKISALDGAISKKQKEYQISLARERKVLATLAQDVEKLVQTTHHFASKCENVEGKCKVYKRTINIFKKKLSWESVASCPTLKSELSCFIIRADRVTRGKISSAVEEFKNKIFIN